MGMVLYSIFLGYLQQFLSKQTSVGIVVKIEDDEHESVYGFVSVLNLQRYKFLPSLYDAIFNEIYLATKDESVFQSRNKEPTLKDSRKTTLKASDPVLTLFWFNIK